MSSPQLTAAVVGTGFIGPVHVEGLRRAGMNIAGIVGSTGEKSQAAADRLGLPPSCGRAGMCCAKKRSR